MTCTCLLFSTSTNGHKSSYLLHVQGAGGSNSVQIHTSAILSKLAATPRSNYPITRWTHASWQICCRWRLLLDFGHITSKPKPKRKLMVELSHDLTLLPTSTTYPSYITLIFPINCTNIKDLRSIPAKNNLYLYFTLTCRDIKQQWNSLLVLPC